MKPGTALALLALAAAALLLRRRTAALGVRAAKPAAPAGTVATLEGTPPAQPTVARPPCRRLPALFQTAYRDTL